MQSVTKKQMIELDRLMLEEYGISLAVMMENAGKGLAEFVRSKYSEVENIVVLAGSGNNGGGGMVSARHLANWGKSVEVIIVTKGYKDTALEQLQALEHTSANITESSELSSSEINKILNESDVVIDALLGYSVQGAPKGEVKRLIDLANTSRKPIVSLDLPSGLSPDKGAIEKPIIIAGATLTIAFPKKSFFVEGASKYVGKLFVVDISVPREWYKEHGAEDLFKNGFIAELFK